MVEKDGWHFSASYLDQWIFDNAYPRTTGYAVFSPNSAERSGKGWGEGYTSADTTSGHSIGRPATGHVHQYMESIAITGSVNVDPDGLSIKSFKTKANVYDANKSRSVFFHVLIGIIFNVLNIFVYVLFMSTFFIVNLPG